MMELTFKLNKTTDFVLNYLTDMQKFASVHPVIYQIDELGKDRYLVHEKLRFGFIPFSFTYPVTIEKSASGEEVIIRATVFKLSKIEMKFVLISDNDRTVVKESVRFKSPFPIQSVMKSVFRKQHAQLFKNMDNLSI